LFSNKAEHGMQLKSYTDYSLRVLIYLGLHPERLVTIAEVAGVFRISRNHLMKVAQKLAACGYIRSVPGKKGGMALGHPPQLINVGEVVRRMEAQFNLVECFDADRNTCCLVSVCTLGHVLREATNRFLESLDRYTLEDLLKNRSTLMSRTTRAGSGVGLGRL
jgi:Rrf2 family nitric oxide-sensitive transcriptional repressor